MLPWRAAAFALTVLLLASRGYAASRFDPPPTLELAKVTGLLANAGISIDAVLQREADEIGGEGSTQTDLIILTHDTREGTLDDAMVQLQALPTVLAPIVRIRKEELS